MILEVIAHRQRGSAAADCVLKDRSAGVLPHAPPYLHLYEI